MPYRILLPLALILCVALGASLADPSEAASPSGEALDQEGIHWEYSEGNLDRVLASLEGFMSRNKTYSLEDSIFLAKHLGVVYSASPKTREKGRYYMYRLLALQPSVKLTDMYVSEEIERIFEKVREEFLARQRAFGVDSTQDRAADPVRKRRRNAKFYAAAGGVALAAVGVTSYILFSSSPKQTEKIYDIP